ALMLTVSARAIDRARSVRCEAQLRGFGPAVQSFRDANRDQLPYADDFVSFGTGQTRPWDQLREHLDARWPVVDRSARTIHASPPLVCPSDRAVAREVGTSYAYPLWVYMSVLGQAATTRAVTASPGDFELFRDADEFHTARDGERGMNALWADYSVRRVRAPGVR